jgi:hypothetical protein
MLTGRYPPTRRTAPHFSQYPANLFTLLSRDYDLRVRESILQLCPPRDCAGQRTGGGLPTLLNESAALLTDLVSPRAGTDAAAPGFHEPSGGADAPRRGDVKFAVRRPGPSQPDRFATFLAGLRPAARPTLHFLHLQLPHQPFRYLASGTRYDVPEDLPRIGFGRDAETTAPDPATRWWYGLARQRHLSQVRYVDGLLGAALDRMRATGLFDRALVVVTSDHGMAFTPGTLHRTVDAGQRNAGELGWVPLFVKAPGQARGAVDDRNWLHVDLLPTVADYAGVAVPWRMDGVSARRAPRESTDKPFTWQPGATNSWDKGPLLQLDGARHAAALRAGADAVVDLPAPPLPRLVGRPLDEFRVVPGGPPATVADADAFRRVDPDRSVPAVVRGDLPASVPAGTPLAIAVNGTIGAVVPVLDARPGAPRFGGLVADGDLFRRGANRLELFLVGDDGRTLTRLRG